MDGAILNDREIREYIASGRLIIDPFDDKLVNPASLDYRLGNKFGVVSATRQFGVMDPSDPTSFETVYVEKDEYILKPKGFVITSSLESFSLPDNISAYALGKSSLGRLGLQSSVSFAGWVDCGFSCEHMTLELFNASDCPILLRAGMKIGQYIFFKHEPAERPYGSPGVGRYQGQSNGAGSLGL